jgi:hypothetical protein
VNNQRVLRRSTDEFCQSTGVPEQSTGVPEQSTGVPGQSTGVPGQKPIKKNIAYFQ